MADYYFLTGRERTVTWSGTTAGAAFRNLSYPYYASVTPGIRLKVLDVSFLWEASQIKGGGMGYVDMCERITILLPNGWGADVKENIRRFYPPGPYTGNIDGSWQVQATLQELVHVTEIPPVSADNAPPYIRLRFFERLKPGSTLFASASCNGVTASVSAVVPSDTTYEVIAAKIEPDVWVSLEVRYLYGDATYEGECTLTYFSQQAPVGNPNFSQTLTEGTTVRTISLTDTQAYAYARTTRLDPITVAQITATLWGTKQAFARFNVFAMQDYYPQNLVVRIREKRNTWKEVTLTSGIGSLNIAQRRWFITQTLYGYPSEYDINEYDTVVALLDSSSLAAIGEDDTATRLFGHGWVYNGVDFRHDTRYVLDTCNTLANTAREWVAVQHCTLSTSGGAIVVSPTGSQPIVRRTCLSPPHEYWNSYGYLRLYLRASVADAPFTVVLGNKRYSASTKVAPNTWTEVYIDLCCPTNATAPYDLQNTMYPDGRADGDYWGVTRVSEMRLELANAIWDIGEISLDVAPWSHKPEETRMPNHSITLCPSRGWWADTGRGYTVRRFVTGQSDGKLALEIEDVRQTGSGFSIVSIADMPTFISASDSNGATYWPGWYCNYTCNPPVSIPSQISSLYDYYLTASRPASWIGGGGLIIHANTWESTAKRLQLPAGSNLSVPIQVLYDEIDWYPGCTDVWNLDGSGPDDTLRILFGTVLRSRAFGIIIDFPNKTRFKNGSVQLERTDVSENGGSASLEPWEGYYETGSPFAKGQKQYKLIILAENASGWETIRQYYTRLPMRTVSTVSPVLPAMKYFATCNFTCTRVAEVYYDRGNERLYIQWSGIGYSIPFSSAVLCPLSLSATENPVHLALVSSDKTWLTVLDSQLSSSPPGVKTTVYRIREGVSNLEMTAITPEGSIPPLLCFGYILLLPCSIKVEPLQSYTPVVTSGTGILSGIYRFPDFLKAIRSGQSVYPLLRVVPEGLPAWNRNQPFPFWFHRWHWNLFAHDFLLLPKSSTEATICEIAAYSSHPDDVRKLLPTHTLTRATGVDNEKARLWATEGRFLVVERSTDGNILKGIEGQSQRETLAYSVAVTMTYTQRNDFNASIILHEGSWEVQGWDLLPDREWAIIMVGYKEPNGLHTSIWRWGNRSTPPLILLREV